SSARRRRSRRRSSLAGAAASCRRTPSPRSSNRARPRRAEPETAPRRWTLRRAAAVGKADLRPQNDLERGAEAGSAADAEAALDCRGPVAHVPQPVPGGCRLGREAFAVVLDGDETLAGEPPADLDFGAGRVRVAADVPEPLLDDAEDLDLLVRSETDRRVDLEVHLE